MSPDIKQAAAEVDYVGGIGQHVSLEAAAEAFNERFGHATPDRLKIALFTAISTLVNVRKQYDELKPLMDELRREIEEEAAR